MIVSYHAFYCSMMQMAYSSLSFESIHVNLNFSLKSYYLLKITFISGIVNLLIVFVIFIMSYCNVLNEEKFISELSTFSFSPMFSCRLFCQYENTMLFRTTYLQSSDYNFVEKNAVRLCYTTFLFIFECFSP